MTIQIPLFHVAIHLDKNLLYVIFPCWSETRFGVSLFSLFFFFRSLFFCVWFNTQHNECFNPSSTHFTLQILLYFMVKYFFLLISFLPFHFFFDRIYILFYSLSTMNSVFLSCMNLLLQRS